MLTERPVSLSKANSELMPFNTAQQHALEGQQPATSYLPTSVSWLASAEDARCRFPCGAQIEVAKDVWLFLYINHTIIPSACH